MLHKQQGEPLSVDHEVDVSLLPLDEQVETIRNIWATASR